LAHQHFHHHRQSILALVERGQVGGELLRKHGEGRGRGVDGGGVALGVSIDRGPAPHQGIHVGDRHQDLDLVLPQRLGYGELVQIPGVVVVDGGPGQASQVARLAATGRLVDVL
jgi:hypothetical protein